MLLWRIGAWRALRLITPALHLTLPAPRSPARFRSNFKLPAHEPGYPGGIFAPFVPGSLEELKVKEIKNGEARCACCACSACYACCGGRSVLGWAGSDGSLEEEPQVERGALCTLCKIGWCATPAAAKCQAEH